MKAKSAAVVIHIMNLLLFIIGTLPLFLMAVAALRGTLLDVNVGEERVIGVKLLAGGVAIAIVNYVFFVKARRMGKPASNVHKVCPKCGYDLRGRPTAGCPECGWNREEVTD